MYIWIAIAIIIIQFIIIGILVINNVIKQRTVYQSIISVWKISMYLKQDEEILKSHQEWLKVMLKYIESRMRAVVLEQNSESIVNWKSVTKSIETIYTERWQMIQLWAIRTYINSLIKKEKEQ